MADESKPSKTDDMSELKERFTTDLEVARRYMRPIHELMDKYYEMYRNRWSENETDFQISDLFAYVETVVPILTNNRTRSRVKAEYPDYVQHAEGMTFILDNTFDVNHWDYMAQDIARKAEIYRSAIAYTGYDTEAKNGTGCLCIKDINIRWCYLDPAATDLQESSFFFYVEPKRISQVIKAHPKKAQDIKDAVGKRDIQTGQADQNKSGQWFQSWVRTIRNAVSFNQDKKSMQRLTEFQFTPEMNEEEKRKNSVAYIHYWYRDEETDKWRVSYWADDLPLEDRDNPFIHEMLPFDIYSPTKDILSSMGVPMAEHIENLNYEKNVIMDMIVSAGKRAVDPILLYNTTAGIKDPKKMRTQARDEGMLGVNNPDMVPLNALAEFFTPPPLPAYADNLPDRFSAMEDRITGVNDSFRGLSDATSGKEVQLKQEAAYTRIKTKVDNWELFVTRISNKIIVNAMQFCKETRAYRVKGDYTKYANMGDNAPFEVKPIPNGQDAQGQPINNQKEFFLYANPNEWTKDPPESQDSEGDQEDAAEGDDRSAKNVQAAFRVLQMTAEIEAGSSLPTSPIARKEEAMELFKAGAIDAQGLLDAYDYPDREVIYQRVIQMAQYHMQIEQQNKLEQINAAGQWRVRRPMEQIDFTDLPPEGQVQMAAQAGIQLSPEHFVQNQVRTAQIQAASQSQPAAQQMPQQQPPQSAQPQAAPQQQLPDVAGGLDAIRQAVPELKGVSDQELMALISRMPHSA